MKLLLQPFLRLGAKKNDALLFCNLGIILLCFAMPTGDHPITSAAPGVWVDLGILACLALVFVMSGQSRLRLRALAWLVGFWIVAAVVVITARTWTPMFAPVWGGVLAYCCVARWRFEAARSARRKRVLKQEVAAADAAAQSPAACQKDTARDREVMLQMMHDLRSPLSTVLVMLEKQSAQSNDPQQDEFVDSVRDLVQYSLSVAQDCMYVSRAERLDKAKFLPVSLQDLGREAVDQTELLAERKRIDIRVRECSETMWVAGDYCMLLRAVVNVLDNAIKYSGPSSRITLTVQRQGDMGRICVADQGIGIQDVDVPKLCQAFYQIESDGRRGDGVGLGLSLVMAVADAHSGNLSVESRPEAGSIFSLTFPLMHKESNEKKCAARREKFSASLHPAS